MRKLSIITLHRAENYGSVLQAYALQKKIEELGHEAEILDYHPERYTNTGKLRRLKDKSAKFQNPLLLLLAKILIYPSYIRKNRVFNEFINTYLHLSSSSFATNEKAKKNVFDADMYCTGSDQVWNSHWNEGVEKALYLDFVPKGKMCFSYAASIGLSDIDENEKNEVARLLDKYEFISVREDSGVDILKAIGRKDVVQTLDPTLLLSKEEWEEVADNAQTTSHYVLTYNLHHDPRIDKYADMLAKKHRLKVRNISYNWHDVVRKGHLDWCPSVERFLALIRNAEYVVADSFHATAFSIIFERPFVSITPEVASSRISSILNLLGIAERNIQAFNDTSIMESPIDYQDVKERLKQEQFRSIEFLKRVIATKKFTHNK